jgi:hypothetical protein
VTTTYDITAAAAPLYSAKVRLVIANGRVYRVEDLLKTDGGGPSRTTQTLSE